MRYKDFIEQSIAFLAGRAGDPFHDPKADVMALLGAITGKDRSYFIAFADKAIDAKTLEILTACIERRLKGEPIAYIIGHQGFRNLYLATSPHTLIPRPETELLVEIVLERAYQLLKERQTIRILDLGTGVGAIALSLAQELGRRAHIVGVDRIVQAVEIAKKNAQTHHITTACFYQSDWFCEIKKREHEPFDIIVSNPPYIDEHDQHLRVGDVRFEPKSALVADDNGYADLFFIIEHAPLFLTDTGMLFLEHGESQAVRLRAFFAKNGFYHTATIKDYAGYDRISFSHKNPALGRLNMV